MRRQAPLVLYAAFWGMLVDRSLLPVLAPTENSTIVQATTAALFAVIGILCGPLVGGLCGVVRDGTSGMVTIFVHPGLVSGPWLGAWLVDILEDVVLGLVPGLVALRVRRIDVLVAVAAITAWLSLPLLLTADALVAGAPGRVGHVLTTLTGNWDQPVDPGLTVYALLTGCFVALGLLPWVIGRRGALVLCATCGAAALAMLLLGAHY